MNNLKSGSDKAWWVVVADEANAVLYARERLHGPLKEMARLENSVARAKAEELLTDRSGRAFDSQGQGRHAMGNERSDPRRRAATAFAKQIAQRVCAGLQNGRCRGYAFVAAPRFLGLLREAANHLCSKEPYLTIDKDVVNEDVEFIAALLDKR